MKVDLPTGSKPERAGFETPFMAPFIYVHQHYPQITVGMDFDAAIKAANESPSKFDAFVAMSFDFKFGFLIYAKGADGRTKLVGWHLDTSD